MEIFFIAQNKINEVFMNETEQKSDGRMIIHDNGW